MRAQTRFAAALLVALGLGLGLVSGCRQILGIEDPVPCESSAECAIEGEPCVAGECVDGGCAYSQIAAGSPAASDIVGDCSQTVCDDAGSATTTPDPDDTPTDDIVGDCKRPICKNDGTPGNEIDDTDVPADDTPDDCRIPACDADGNVVEIDDPAGCDCEVGEPLPCYDGPVGTDENSPCMAGTALCQEGGTLGECMDQVLPAPDSCFTTAVDEDCSGQNNQCSGDDVWAWGFGGTLSDGAVSSVYLQSDDPFGGDTLASVLFTQSIDIDGTPITGSAAIETELVRITRQGDATPALHLAAAVSSLTRRGQLVFLGGTLEAGQSEDFGSGEVFAPVGNSDGVIAALNQDDLSLAWKQRIVSNMNDGVTHVVPRLNGGVIAQGKVRGAAVFATGGTSYSPLSAVDEFLVAYSDAGAVEWVTRWPASTYSVADVAVDPVLGDIYVCGSSASALIVTNPSGAAVTLHADPPSVDGWAFRVDGQSGNVSTATSGIVKIASPGTDTCDSVTLLPDGGRVIGGTVTQTLTLGSVTLLHTDTVADGFVMTTTSSGTPVAAKMFDITAGSIDISAMDAASDGSIMVGGRFQGGSLKIGTATAIDAPSGRTDLFIAKFSPTLSELPAPTAFPLHYFSSGGDVFMNELRIGPDYGAVVTGVMTGPFSIGGAPTDYVADLDAYVFKITQ